MSEREREREKKTFQIFNIENFLCSRARPAAVAAVSVSTQKRQNLFCLRWQEKAKVNE